MSCLKLLKPVQPEKFGDLHHSARRKRIYQSKTFRTANADTSGATGSVSSDEDDEDEEGAPDPDPA
ncbi:hypothetical protein M407DRAFT_34975 [Tulasnella calospora MUT 4182]|uniref:Uncharacterized protein n=1 Tax=Tulasnella calospora MUT 4182 TaxID=1051891 RepID=A0A0C3L133_9AGAM|nr:hypothetical protein M407DRAFT_34975 [Tulasnella calospora MUT 4182]